jgi:hypothetical protein
MTVPALRGRPIVGPLPSLPQEKRTLRHFCGDRQCCMKSQPTRSRSQRHSQRRWPLARATKPALAGAEAERMVRRPTPGHWGHPGDRPARGTGRGRRPRHRSNADPCSTFRPTETPRSPSPAVWRWRTTNWTTSFERPTRAVEPAIELHDWAAKIARHRSERRRALAASAAGVVVAAITVTFRRTTSAVNSGSRSLCPSAQRYSIVTFRLSPEGPSVRAHQSP